MDYQIKLNYKELTFLVAGGTGFVGGALVKKLISNGAKVRATYFSSKPFFFNKNLEWVHANLKLEKDCNKVVKKIDIVIIAAAVTSGAKDIVNNPLMHVTPNIVINSQILASCYNESIKKVLFISSAAAYPNLDERLLRENDMMKSDPEDVYFAAGWMKRYSEILCYTYSKKIEKPMATVVVRPTNIYGPGDKIDWNKSHVTAATIRKVLERHQPIEVWGDGKDVRDLIFIDDFVEGILLSLQHSEDFLDVNIGSGKTYSINELLDLVIKIDNFKKPIIKYNKNKPRTSKSVKVSIKKASQLLGFGPKVSIEAGLMKTIVWMKNKLKLQNINNFK